MTAVIMASVYDSGVEELLQYAQWQKLNTKKIAHITMSYLLFMSPLGDLGISMPFGYFLLSS